MALERIEDHTEQLRDRKPSSLPVDALGIFATAGAAPFDKAPVLEDERRAEIEGEGFDPERVQAMIDWVQENNGIAGQIAAAYLRGAFNDLVERVNVLETPPAVEQS